MKKNALICFVSPLHDADYVRIHHKQAVYAAAEGYRVVSIAQAKSEKTIDGVKILPIKRYDNRIFRFLFTSLFCAVKCAKLKPDIIHIHHPLMLGYTPLLRYWVGAKIIYDVHEDYAAKLYVRPWLPDVLRPTASMLFSVYEGIFTAFCDLIITTTKHDAKRFKQKVLIAENHPIISDEIRCEKEDIFAYAGALEHVRGVDIAINAINMLEDPSCAKLVLMGEFKDERFRKRVQSMDLARVEFLGQIDHKDVRKILSKSRAGLALIRNMPGYENASYNKIFEYMEAGIPSISSDLTQFKKIIGESKCGLIVETLDPIHVAEKMREILANPKHTDEMGVAGRRAALERYNWDNQIKKILEAYSILLDTI